MMRACIIYKRIYVVYVAGFLYSYIPFLTSFGDYVEKYGAMSKFFCIIDW